MNVPTRIVAGFLSSCLMMTQVHAQDLDWSGAVNVTGLYPTQWGLALMVQDTGFPHQGDPTCNNGAVVRLSIRKADHPDNYEVMTAVAMTGFGMGVPFNILYDKAYTGCWIPVDRFRIDRP